MRRRAQPHPFPYAPPPATLPIDDEDGCREDERHREEEDVRELKHKEDVPVVKL